MKKYIIRDALLDIIKKYERGEIKITDIYEEAEYFSEITFQDYPNYDEGDIRSLHKLVLAQLEYVWRIFPEDIPLIKKALLCSQEEVYKVKEEWEKYWEKIDFTQRYYEGKKRGYWD